MIKCRVTFSTFWNGSEACRGAGAVPGGAGCSPQGAGGLNPAPCCAFARSVLILRSAGVAAEDLVSSEWFCTMYAQQHPCLKQKQGPVFRTLPCTRQCGAASTAAAALRRTECLVWTQIPPKWKPRSCCWLGGCAAITWAERFYLAPAGIFTAKPHLSGLCSKKRKAVRTGRKKVCWWICGVQEWLQRRFLARAGDCSALHHWYMEKVASPRQRGLGRGLCNSCKCDFINLSSYKVQWNSVGSRYFFMDRIFTAAIMLPFWLTVTPPFIRTL